MKAPILDGYINRFRREIYSIDKTSHKLLDRLYSILDEFKPYGNEEKYILWLCFERGSIEDYYDYETALDEGIVNNRDEYEECWKDEYPDEYVWYEFTASKYQDHCNIFLNGTPILQLGPDCKGWEYDISELLDGLLEAVNNAFNRIKAGNYEKWLYENLPYKYRTGTIPMKVFWGIYPNTEKLHFRNISKEECLEFAGYINIDPNDKPFNRVEKMTVDKYLSICKQCYIANHLDGAETETALSLYKKYADDRDGGLINLNLTSTEEFDKWYAIPYQEKWKIENPSHLWEIIAGSSRTRVNLYVHKDKKGYYFSLYTNKFCCPERAVLIYNALRKQGVPIVIDSGKEIAEYLSGNGKIGIVPCFDLPTDYYYHGFSDMDVGEFMHLPNKYNDEVISKITWEPIAIAELKS